MELFAPYNTIVYASNAIIFALSSVGNAWIVVALVRKRSLRTTTLSFVGNLALAYLITLLWAYFVPLRYDMNEGLFADALCKVFIGPGVTGTALLASIFTLTVLAVERYQAVVHPMSARFKLRDDTVRYAVAAIWLLTFALVLPVFIFLGYSAKGQKCTFDIPGEHTRSAYEIFAGIVVVFIPLVVITFCYACIGKEVYFGNSVAPLNVPAQEEAANRR
ncbi:somatostatin receptor type 2-like [Nematostella vectensis]|uniref:somatostatin receptor type 2-like n=1 Tax=Nematostella vectensis TaxID=45351 RepID=UPI002077012D|nr:somatostatin receptor type 2-like [Nematostella vectensis]